MYICEHCGELIEELPSERYYDRVDGNWAMSGWVEEEDNSCSCGGDFVEAVKCKICGEWTNPQESNICKECLKEEMTLENAIEYSREYGYGYEIELPDFFKIYSQKEIEEILVKHIRSTKGKEQSNVIDYCEHDIGCFSEFIETKHK